MVELHDEASIKRLEEISSSTRKLILQTLAEAKSGHPGGSLSAVELLVALYFSVMRHDPKNPKWPDRDRFILSKGHAAPLLYSILAQQGYFPIEELKTLRKINSMLQGHPDTKKTPGVEMCAGSEGVGLSVAIGEALAARIDKKDYRVYVMMGDGEMEEGQIWEASYVCIEIWFRQHYCDCGSQWHPTGRSDGNDNADRAAKFQVEGVQLECSGSGRL